MTETELLFQIEEPILSLRTQLDHARFIMQDIMESFFHEINNDPDSADGMRFIAHSFKRNAARAEVVSDAILHMHGALLALENVYSRLGHTDCTKGGA